MRQEEIKDLSSSQYDFRKVRTASQVKLRGEICTIRLARVNSKK
jgi:hypothetical protein